MKTVDINKVSALINQLIAELGLTAASPNSRVFESVYDVQPEGYYRLGAVERFREELRNSGEKLKLRFADLLPEYWFVQDGDAYAQLTVTQDQLQDFNTNNARFTLRLFGGFDLWSTFADAVRPVENPEDGSLRHERILVNGKPVGVMAADMPRRGNIPGTTNPRVEDVDRVIRAAYANFYMRNKDATHDLSELPTG